MLQQFDVRMRHIIATLKNLCPRVSVACLQEVTPRMLQLLHQDIEICHRFDLSSNHIRTTEAPRPYCVVTLVDKALQCFFTVVPVQTSMDRELLIAHCQSAVDGHSSEIVVGNIHLESVANHPIREQQLHACHKALNAFISPTCLLVGDFNFCSLRNFVPPHDVLENDSLAVCLPGFEDMWLQQLEKKQEKVAGEEEEEEEEEAGSPTTNNKRRPQTPTTPEVTSGGGGGTFFNFPVTPVIATGSDNTENMGVVGTPDTSGHSHRGVQSSQSYSRGGGGAVEGFTYDSVVNGLVAYKHERMRYDRMMLRTAVDRGEGEGGRGRAWVASTMQLLGTERIGPRQTLYTRGSGRGVVQGLWPSDHFGLSLTLTPPATHTPVTVPVPATQTHSDTHMAEQNSEFS